MKVKMSTFLMAKKSLAKELIDQLYDIYDYASILGIDTVGKRYALKKTGIELNDSFWAERGYVVRVYNGVHYFEYSFNELTREVFPLILERIKTLSMTTKALMVNQEIEAMHYGLLEDEAINEAFLSEVEIQIDSMSHEEKLDKMRKVMEDTLLISDELIDARVFYEDVLISKMFLSKNRDLQQAYTWSNATIVPIAIRDGQTKYAYSMMSGLKGPELLDELHTKSTDAVQSVIDLLGSSKIEPGEYDIILDPDMSGLLAHEAFGHGVEMDMFVKHRAKAVDYINKQVAAECVNMYDGAKSAREVSSYLFDDEGVLGTNTKIIDKGILKSGISDALSATALHTVPTGNGKRQSFENKVYTRMTNTFFDKGENTLEEMITSIKQGYLIECFLGGMEDPKNWGIQCVASSGKEIIDGKLTGKVHSPIYITGYVPDLLKSISMATEEVILIGNGICGKGHKEFVKTATGGPYIKAKGRLS